MAACLRPWRDDYQLLCSIDSVSGEMKSISPFKVPDKLNLEDQKATSIESHFKVIETINDYQESKAFRARLSGAISSFWNIEANSSALDSAKVNSKDIFGYYSLLFTKSRIVVNSATLANLPLTKEAERAVRCGKFREQYGDMIVVGFITGGEAEAVLRVTSFKEDRRDSIRKAIRTALHDNASSTSGRNHAGVTGVHDTSVTVSTGSTSAAGAAGEVSMGRDDLSALQDATMTMVSRRTGVTHQDQLHNPNNFPQLLKQLTKAAENTGVKISALCYRIEVFSQVPVDVLGFARTVVDENVSTLTKQFAQVQFVYNSCEAHLAQSAAAGGSSDVVLRDFRKLKEDACAAMQRFSQYKGYRDVGNLAANDSTRTVGSQLVQRFDDLCEKMRAAEVRAKAQQQLEKAVRARRLGERGLDALASPLSVGSLLSVSIPTTPKPWAPSSIVTGSVTGPSTSQPFRDGVLHGQLLAGRNFGSGKLKPYLVIKLDGKHITSPTLTAVKESNIFIWHYEFNLEVTSKLLTEDAALVLEVWDKNTLRADKYLGAVTVPLRLACGKAAVQNAGSLLAAMVAEADRSKPTWYPIEKVDSGNKYKCRGELQLKLRFSTDLASLQGPELSKSSGSGSDGLSSKLLSPLTDNLASLAPYQPQPPPPPPQQQLLPMLYPPPSPLQPPPPQPMPFVDGTLSYQNYPAIGTMPTPAYGIPVAPDSGFVPQVAAAAAVAPAITSSVATVNIRQQPVYQGFACNASDSDVCATIEPSRGSPGAEPVQGALGKPSVQVLGGRVDQQAPPQTRSEAEVWGPARLSNAAPVCAPPAPAPVPATSKPQPQMSDKKDRAPALQMESETKHGKQHVSCKAPGKSTTGHSEHAGARPQPQQEQQQPKKKARRGGFLGFLVRLTVTGVVLGSAGAAAVVVGRGRFGVDLVAESKRLAVEYGTIARRTSITWGKQGGTAVRSWTARLAEKVRRRQKVVGGGPAADACGAEIGSSAEVTISQQ